MTALLGSCLCGVVRYEITAPFRRANLCHCSRCQKHSGAGALAQGRVPRSGFRLLSCPQQLGFEEEPGFLGFVSDKRCINAPPTETASCRIAHRLSS